MLCGNLKLNRDKECSSHLYSILRGYHHLVFKLSLSRAPFKMTISKLNRITDTQLRVYVHR